MGGEGSGTNPNSHRWAPGVSGNPAGRAPGQPLFPAMLRRELAKTDRRNRSQMQKLAEKVVNMAVAGDMDAVRWLADRVDGKVAQNVNVSSEQTVHVVPWLPAMKEAINSLPDSQDDSTAVETPILEGVTTDAGRVPE